MRPDRFTAINERLSQKKQAGVRIDPKAAKRWANVLLSTVRSQKKGKSVIHASDRYRLRECAVNFWLKP